jgi:ubiquinone/menaquinone biosynthesis C-methylase UbiE
MENDSPKGRHCCPWWLGFAIDNPLRRLIHDPEKLLSPYVREGMRVLDVGCGMGLFSLGMAKLVGPSGSVLAVDVQQKMLDALARRSRDAGLAERIQTKLCASNRLDVKGPFDFALCFWMLHEAPNARAFMEEIYEQLTGKGRWLVVEPKKHVSPGAFESMRRVAERVGFAEVGFPSVNMSQAVLLEKPDDQMDELVLE